MRAALVFALFVAVQAVSAADFIQPQIVGGNEAQPHQFPWQVAIFIYVEGGKSFCGGSLIAKRWVVSAAHCASPPGHEVHKYEVVLGAHNVSDINEEGRVVMEVNDPRDVIVNPAWKGLTSGDLSGDISLFRLPQDAPLSDKIQIVRLPNDSQKKNSFWREKVTISGWGLTHSSEHSIAPKLRYVESKVVSNFYCKLRFFFLIATDNNICISGWGGKGACQGDSGGPMVLYEEDGLPTLLGVTSFGFGFNCEWGWPTAYTRITSYLDWIKSHVEA